MTEDYQRDVRGARKDYLRGAECEFYECAVGSLVGMALGM